MTLLPTWLLELPRSIDHSYTLKCQEHAGCFYFIAFASASTSSA